MKQRKKKWWQIVLPVALVVAAAAAGLYLYFAPKLALSSALPRLFAQMEERFAGDPMKLVLECCQGDGAYTADMVLTTERDIAGPVTYEMTAQTDGTAHRFFADGTIQSSEKAVNVSLYMDAEFAAVSSAELVKGVFYGITYDTFESDVRKIPLVSPFVSDQVLARWNRSVRDLKEKMSRDYPSIPSPRLSEQDMKTLLLGIAALPCDREEVSASVNGEALACRKLDYTFDGKQLGKILEKATGKPFPEDTTVRASFYLYEDTIVRFLFQYRQGETLRSYNVTFGTNPLQDPMTFQAEENLAGEGKRYSLGVETKRDKKYLTQTWRFSDSSSSVSTYTYAWESATGTMHLTTDVVTEPVQLQLAKTDSGLQVTTADFGKLMQILTKDSQTAEVFDGAQCSMALRGGSQIETPPYRNLDTWTFDDLLILLGGLGSLVGIPTTE